jgi:hypothetical protein
MTQAEYDSLRGNLAWYFSDTCNKLCIKRQLGSQWGKQFYILLLLKGYMKIFNEYTLQPEATTVDDYINFFTVAEMKSILQKVNELLTTSYYADFILDP